MAARTSITQEEMVHLVAAVRHPGAPMATEQGRAQRDLDQMVASDQRRPQLVAVEEVPRRLEAPLLAHLAVMVATDTRGSTDRHMGVEAVAALQIPATRAVLEARAEAEREAIRIRLARWRQVAPQIPAEVAAAIDQAEPHLAQAAPALSSLPYRGVDCGPLR